MPTSKSQLKSLLFISAIVCLPLSVKAELPHPIVAGEPAVADHVRGNFEYLDDRIIELGVTVADQSNGVNQEVALDCDADANAFLDAPINSHTTYIVTGMCNGPIWIDERENVTIMGETGKANDGIILQSGLAEHPYAVVGAWRSKHVKLSGLTLDASNYVSKDYVFGGVPGSNVAGLGAGDGSHVNVTNVDFLGGDYGVDVYRNAMVRLKEGINITGFNRAGLSVFMGAHIAADEPITVTGIVNVSTDDYVYAINAVSNGTVNIRNGGTFTAGSNAQTAPLHPDDIYPVAVWVGDNATLLVTAGSGSTVFNGGVETGYSAMVRMRGDTTVHGVLGAYHGAIMHLTDIVQDTDQIWIGDGGYIRFESANLSPQSQYDYPIDLYRSGRARINNTTINMGGGTISVSGFSVLNLRGTTNMGTAGISCGDGRNVSIRASVTHGPVSCW